MGVGMNIQKAIEKYEQESEYWVDQFGIPLPKRVALFQAAFRDFSQLAGCEVNKDSASLANFLYYYFWFIGQHVEFEREIDLATRSFKPAFSKSFGLISTLATLPGLTSREAQKISAGMKANELFRPITMAIIAEFTRTSRLRIGMKVGNPVPLGDFYLLFAALSASPDEIALYRHLANFVADGEKVVASTKCQMKYCQSNAVWAVGCPLDASNEYLCEKHKTENDLSYDTFRIIFSNSCGHAAERRDCTYTLVSRASDEVELPLFEQTPDEADLFD